jgi:hypothetical protein
MLENTEGAMKKDNPEKLATLGTQDTGQIHVREYRRGNEKGQSRETVAPSVFSNMYVSRVLCTLCCQFLWIVLFHYPFGIL